MVIGTVIKVDSCSPDGCWLLVNENDKTVLIESFSEFLIYTMIIALIPESENKHFCLLVRMGIDQPEFTPKIWERLKD